MLEVVVLLILRALARGNDAEAPLSLGVRHKEKSPIQRQADKQKPLLALIFAVVETLDRKRVPEDGLREIETDPVIAQIGGGFGSVPFKIQSDHTTGSPCCCQWSSHKMVLCELWRHVHGVRFEVERRAFESRESPCRRRTIVCFARSPKSPSSAPGRSSVMKNMMR